ncbi:MAG TPA: winged helix-turn-helix domain-containing protein [Nocardioidaceae bacterium]|nr:winged helix-turn-helix domain-containing protein [Nocardioidaceae bacterium]
MAEAPDEESRVALDPKAMRVLAHPIRSRLLSELRMEGPANATALARALDTNTGATSYHLRKLAEVGLVEETDDGQGRERWWRATHNRHSWDASTVVDDPDGQAAASWLEQEYLRRFVELAQGWLRDKDRWPLDWRDAAGQSDYLLRLSPGRLQALKAELYAVLERYGAAEPDEDEPDEGTRTFIYLNAFPDYRGERR